MTDARIITNVENHVAHTLLNRADKRNALDHAMFEALLEHAAALKKRTDVRAVILSGAGKGFCAGLDFPAFMASMNASDGPKLEPFAHYDHTPANYVQRTGMDWKHLPMPVIAALHGHVLGGGIQIALAADIRIAAPDTLLSVLEIKWGLIPDMSISQTLRDLVGLDTAKEITWTGRMVGAEEALRLGLITEINEDPLQRAKELATTIASKSPDAIRRSKTLFEQSWHSSPAEGLALEETLQKEILGKENQMEAVMANFQKRDAVYKDPQ